MKYEMNSEDKEFIHEVDLEKKYSKKIFFGSLIGLGLVAAKYYFSDIDFDTMNKTLSQMNTKELINTSILGLSSLGTFGGGILYGISCFMEKDLMVKLEKENNLEQKLKE